MYPISKRSTNVLEKKSTAKAQSIRNGSNPTEKKRKENARGFASLTS